MTDLADIKGLRVNYSVSLADLMLFADAAGELDACQSLLKIKPEARARIVRMIERLHDAVERAAGECADLLYAQDDGSQVA